MESEDSKTSAKKSVTDNPESRVSEVNETMENYDFFT